MTTSTNGRRPPALWLAAAALAAGLPFALKIAADHDLWWHVRTGQLILAQGALPATDPFSFTAHGARWINHEWLSDVILAGIYALGGGVALSLWRTALLGAVLWLFAALLWRRLPQPLFVLGGVLAAAPLLKIFVNLRPHGFTYLLALVLLTLLDTAGRRPRLLTLVPPLFVLWANLHGGFVLGLGILGCHLAERWLDPQESPASRLRLALVLAASSLAPLVNPYGPRLLTYLVRELGADHSLILEWRGIWTFPDFRLPFVLLVVVPLAALGLGRALRPTAPLVLALLAALATWTHGRFLILLVIFSSLATFQGLAAALARRAVLGRGGLLEALSARRWAWVLVALPLFPALLQFAVDARRSGLRLAVDPWHVPREACEFLRDHELGPNLLLRLDWGGYAIWHLYPDYRVSSDGRNLTIYDAAFVDDMLRAYDEGRFAELATRYDVDVILSEAAGPTYRELMAAPGWRRVHEDPVAAVFVRPELARTLPARGAPPALGRAAPARAYFP